MFFKFICHTERRSTNLLRSLECLQKARVLDVIEIHLVNIYGAAILDKDFQGRKNAYLALMDSKTLVNMRLNPAAVMLSVVEGLVCLDERAFTEYIPTIVSRKCDYYAVHLVTTYFNEYRQTFVAAVRNLTFAGDVCTKRPWAVEITGRKFENTCSRSGSCKDGEERGDRKISGKTC